MKKNDEFCVRPDSLPDLFYKIRVRKNLSQKALAERIGFSEGYVQRVERGKVYPCLNYVIRCSTELEEINPEWARVKWANEKILSFRDKILSQVGPYPVDAPKAHKALEKGGEKR